MVAYILYFYFFLFLFFPCEKASYSWNWEKNYLGGFFVLGFFSFLLLFLLLHHLGSLLFFLFSFFRVRALALCSFLGRQAIVNNRACR